MGRVAEPLVGSTPPEMLDGDIDRMRDYATRGGDLACGTEIGLPILGKQPDHNGELYLVVVWYAYEDWRMWRAPMLDALAWYATRAYPGYPSLTVRSTFPSPTRGGKTERVPVMPADVIAWDVDRLIESGSSVTQEEFVEISDPNRVLH